MLGLDAVDALFSAGPGRMLAGDQVVYAVPGELYGWPIAGGRPRRLAELPDLGSATNDLLDGGGFVRVEAAQPDRLVIARGEGSVFSQGFGSGRQLVVGPPEGPFTDPAGCGEQTGMPAALDGDLLAYRANPDEEDRCAAAAVRRASLVVRDLGADAAVVRVVELPARADDVTEVALAGPYLAYSYAERRDGNGNAIEPLVVVDMRAGSEALRLPAAKEREWALDADGTVVSGHTGSRSQHGCLYRLIDVRRHAPGDRTGTSVDVTPCAFDVFDLRDGVLRFTASRRDGRARFVEHDVATGASRVRAVVSGGLLDADDRHLLARDDSCTQTAPRIIALAGAPARPAGPRRCPVSVRVPRSRSGSRAAVPIRISCLRGCNVDLEARTRKPGTDVTHGNDRSSRIGSGERTVRVPVPFDPRGRPATMHVNVIVSNPVGRPTVVRRRIRLR